MGKSNIDVSIWNFSFQIGPKLHKTLTYLTLDKMTQRAAYSWLYMAYNQNDFINYKYL